MTKIGETYLLSYIVVGAMYDSMLYKFSFQCKHNFPESSNILVFTVHRFVTGLISGLRAARNFEHLIKE